MTMLDAYGRELKTEQEEHFTLHLFIMFNFNQHKLLLNVLPLHYQPKWPRSLRIRSKNLIQFLPHKLSHVSKGWLLSKHGKGSGAHRLLHRLLLTWTPGRRVHWKISYGLQFLELRIHLSVKGLYQVDMLGTEETCMTIMRKVLIWELR